MSGATTNATMLRILFPLIKPSIVYCHTRGHDQSRESLPGNDQTAAALAGISWLEGGVDSGATPLWPATSLGDTGNGFLSAIAVVRDAGDVGELAGLEDGFWAEWRGKDDNGSPHKLTGPELAQLLRPFHIRSRTVWPQQRRPGNKSTRGYFRAQFQEAWVRYCPIADTAAQPSKIIHLQRR